VAREVSFAIVAHVAVLAVGLVRDDEFRIDHRQPHHGAEERPIRSRQGELDGMGIDRGDARDAVGEERRVALADRHQALVGEDDVVGRHDVAGMEFDVGTEREGVVVAVDLPRCRELRRDRRPVLAGDDERVVDVEGEDRADVVDALGGIDLGRGGSVHPEQRLGRGVPGEEHGSAQQGAAEKQAMQSHLRVSPNFTVSFSLALERRPLS